MRKYVYFHTCFKSRKINPSEVFNLLLSLNKSSKLNQIITFKFQNKSKLD